MTQETLEFHARINSGDEMFDYDIRDLDFHMTDQGLRLFASNGVNGGVTTYALSSGAAQLLEQRDHDRGATLRSGAAVVLEQTGLLVQSGAQSGVSQHEITPSGRVTDAGSLTLPGHSAPVTLLASGALSQDRDVLVTLDITGTLSSWRVTESGGEVASRGQFSHAAGRALALSESGLLLVADADLGGLASYRVNASTGQLTALFEIGHPQGMLLETPTALEVVEAYGRNWAVMAAADSDSLTVVSVDAHGRMSMVDHLSDTLATRFGGVTALEVVVVEGRVLVLAGGNDGGLSLLELLPDGRLLHRTAFESGVGQNLHGINAIAAVEIAGHLDIYVSSQNGAGLAQLRYDVSDLVAASQNGTAHDDLLRGAASLSGGAGEDILVAAATGAVLTGGAGADIFMATEQSNPLTTVVRITDFTVGEDSVDLSAFTGLRSLSDLVVRARSGGLEISHDGHRVVIESNTGSALSLSDIWPAGLGTPHRWLVGETIDDGMTYGGSTSDLLSGSSSNDVMDGQGGHDRIDGGDGNDRIAGGDGHDHLQGGNGADSLDGGRDNDQLQGGSGNDQLDGGLGADRLEGGTGGDILRGGRDNDTLLGDAGADHLYGDHGADRLEGGTGGDILRGGRENDTLLGGAGADRLYGDHGADRLEGGTGGDILRGGRENDTLLGGAGADRLYGNHGTDRLHGGRGNDRLYGNGGDDLLKGQSGADLLIDRSGNNVLLGGSGNDSLKSGTGTDILKGGGGHDLLVAGGGRDVLVGGGGRDVLRGGGGADTLNGGGHDDVLNGGNSADVLMGGRGDDRLIGGRGADVFVFARRHGADTIRDFDIGSDYIDLQRLRLSYEDLDITRANRNTVIDTGAGEIELIGIRPHMLNDDDFLF